MYVSCLFRSTTTKIYNYKMAKVYERKATCCDGYRGPTCVECMYLVSQISK